MDVFPLDYAINPGKMSRIKSIIADMIGYISNSVIYSQYDHKEYKQYMLMTPPGKRSYYLRMIVGKICGIIPHRIWVYMFDSFVKSFHKSGYVTIGSGRKGYYGETLKKDEIIPVSKAIFEGIEVKVPGNLHKYLTNLYGDYMTLPPEEKRERHYIMDIEFPKE